jgi:hypothetical protein
MNLRGLGGRVPGYSTYCWPCVGRNAPIKLLLSLKKNADYHFVREIITRKAFDIRFISTHDHLVDVLTKPLAIITFVKFRDNLNMRLSS